MKEPVARTAPLIGRADVASIFIGAAFFGFVAVMREASALALVMGFVAGMAALRWRDMA
jgi:hypothetical protein